MEDEPGGHPRGHQQEVPHDGQRGEDAGMKKLLQKQNAILSQINIYQMDHIW